MSTETERHDWAGASNVAARIKGSAFKYACLSAALFGIVTLLVLLTYVTIDAFQLAEASTEWYAVFVLSIGAPITAYWWRIRGTPAIDVAKTTTGGLLLSVGFGLFLVVVSIIVSPQIWAAYFLLAIFPAGALLVYGDRIEQVSDAHRWALGVAVVGALVASVARAPLTGVLALIKPWLLYFLTFAGPTALALRQWSVSREGRSRIGELAAAGVVGGSLLVGGLVEIGVLVAGDLAIVFLGGLSIPAVIVLTGQRETIAESSTARLGLGAPVVIAGSVLLAVFLPDLLGSSSPDPWVRSAFFQQGPSRLPERSGLYPPIIGSVFMLGVMIVAVFPLGVGAAIYLEEYAGDNRLTQLIQVNLSNLAGVPSVVYGLLGLAVFARGVTLEAGSVSIDLGLGLGTVLTAGLTVGLLVLPIVIISAQEAIRSVPKSVRRASYGMGASRWQTTRNVVLPEAFPGILTGTILALGRAIGETAPLIMIGAATSVSSPPESLFSTVTAMPLQIYAWRGSVQPEFRYGVVAAGVVTLLVVLLGMNAAAIVLRDRFERR
ncbi:phosphate ABC transporter, permease protein PstA [Halobiforma lacisalsi AJ5]|uniref:Phosphate transport system permease protein PstA n=1 Tax=Natronobacterium lacisalsi AJ5 TaxID=358396 RepID=M0LDF3_NATLA|nr:phosphate ABC transporter permease PstA [Halobiforma lacisalsi]APW99474.1 phosphate ABC transporter, permease protein PstA [Halobiforma lacisalsi AJ5]EMA31592.1 phosphate ABC transporter inner membrane subunit PstA [Halobiforma lacisalsi AJ5]